MKDFVKRMISEHSQLVLRITKLHDYVYSSKSDKDDKVEFANKCIQLSAMKKYEEALRARIENQGITIVGTEYLERVATMNFGSDYDIDENSIRSCGCEQCCENE